MDTKLRGDIAEQAAILHALKRGWGVLKPVGDRLAYDLAYDVEGTLSELLRRKRTELPNSSGIASRTP